MHEQERTPYMDSPQPSVTTAMLQDGDGHTHVTTVYCHGRWYTCLLCMHMPVEQLACLDLTACSSCCWPAIVARCW